MSAETYTKAFSYEMLIRKAFNCPSGMKNGAHLSFMQNAMTMESGKSFAKHLGTYEQQLNKVTEYLEKAIQKLSENIKYSKSFDFFETQLNSLKNSDSTEQLMEVVIQTQNELNKYE